MNKLIEVKKLSKKYGEKTVVKDLSFSVKSGEVFGLLGPNGAGKTTTIESMLGLKKFENGTTTILGLNPKKERRQLFQNVGVQLQASNFQNNIKVYEICQEIHILYKHPKDYNNLLKEFGIHHLANQPVDKLSGGEKQKLSLVMALIPDPKVVFLDELTTGLDAQARRDVWSLLTKLKEQGLTIFLTTHYMEEAQQLCDRIMLIRRGEKVVEGTVNEVIAMSKSKTLESAYLWYMEDNDEENVNIG